MTQSNDDEDDASEEEEQWACVSVVSTKEHQDVEDQIEQDVVMCFLGVQDGLDDPDFCKVMMLPRRAVCFLLKGASAF